MGWVQTHDPMPLSPKGPDYRYEMPYPTLCMLMHVCEWRRSKDICSKVNLYTKVMLQQASFRNWWVDALVQMERQRNHGSQVNCVKITHFGDLHCMCYVFGVLITKSHLISGKPQCTCKRSKRPTGYKIQQFFVVVVVFISQNRVSLCNCCSCPWTCFVDQVRLELTDNHLSLPPKSWN